MQDRESDKKGDLTSEKKVLNSYVKYSGIGFQMIGVIGVFTYIGYILDERRNADTPIYTAILSLVGVCIALFLVIRSLKK